MGPLAALWTRDVAADYAPDVPLAGVAALAPASNLPAFVGELAGSSAGVMFGSYLVQSYAQVYPDVDADAYVRPVASVVSREIAERCLSEPSTLVSVASILLGGSSIWSAEPTDGALGERLAENVPAGDGEAPLLLAQGLADNLILPAMQDAYVDGLCAAGGDVEYRTYAGRDHVGVVAADSPLVPDLLAWTEDRFAGAPTTSTC